MFSLCWTAKKFISAECPPRFVAKGAEIDFIFRGTFLSVSEQKQHTLKEYPYENGRFSPVKWRFSPVKFWAYEILSYICTPERV